MSVICNVIHSLVSEERKCTLRCPWSVQCWPAVWGHARNSGASAATVRDDVHWYIRR